MLLGLMSLFPTPIITTRQACFTSTEVLTSVSLTQVPSTSSFDKVSSFLHHSYTMESNKDEALKCLRIAQKHRDAGNLPSARKFCQKSLSLFTTREAELLKESIESAAAAESAGPSSSTGASNGNATTASSTSTETHPSAAGVKRRGDAKADGTAGGMNGEKRKYTAEQLNVVKRIRACKPTDYYGILGGKKDCEEADIKKAYRKVHVSLVRRGVGY